jgi:ABC-type uncharacterized transport system ATPase subunit
MTDAVQPQPATLEQTLPDILMRLVSELHDVAYLIERVEPQMLELGGSAILQSPDSVKVLQGIDLAVQKTRGIAEFIDTITASIPQDLSVDVSTALNLVKLADMQKALATGLRHGHSQPIGKAAGDFDFF